MLVLSRHPGQRVLIGDHVVVTVLGVGRSGIRLGIDAPRGIPVDREEVRLEREGDDRRVGDAEDRWFRRAEGEDHT